MTITEILGFITGAVSVWLAVREHVWNWPVGIANGACFLALFWGSGLYANAALQVLYIGLGAYGWWRWLHGGASRTPLNVRHTSPREAVALAVVTALTGAALVALLGRSAGSTMPFWDGVTTALSLTATYMLTAKLLEHWWVWIAADAIYVPLYASSQLYLTSLVYALFLAMCIAGLVRWTRGLRSAASPVALR
jgi:nicotinamide mononucleotide transporter